ncbi:D-alanyl-D-alanine carboxypeptidase family protein [Streptomyces sp. NPDC001889]
MHAQPGNGPSTEERTVAAPRRPRGVPSPAVVWGAVAVLVLTALCGWLVVSREDGSGSRRAAAPAAGERMALPWPEDGQAGVAITGQGEIGTSGKQTPVPIASVTKVMTAHVVLRSRPLREGEPGPSIPVDQRAADESWSRDESTVVLEAGRRLTQRQLLELLLLPSGNNAARLLARWHSGSEKAFVAEMNRAARDLGMDRTTYTGASGLEATTTSTAADQLLLARAVMRDKVFRSIVATPEVTVGGATGTVVNTNKLLGRDGVVGLKTGSSTPAGGALMWAAETGEGHGSGLILGVVLHQRAGTTPAAGLQAAFDSSRRLITAVRDGLREDRSTRRA